MKNNYPMYNNGLVGLYDYSKIIKMQSQEPIGKVSNQKIIIKDDSITSKNITKRSLKRTTKK